MNIQVLGGEAELGNRGWSAYDSSWVLNANFSTEPPDWPVGIEMGFQLGAANGSVPGEYRDLDWWELYCGATKSWTPLKHLDLQAGVGGRLLVNTLYGPGWFFESEIDNDASLGVYLHAGAWWMFTPAWGIGIDARWADGIDMRLEGEKRDAALTQLLLGVRLVL